MIRPHRVAAFWHVRNKQVAESVRWRKKLLHHILIGSLRAQRKVCMAHSPEVACKLIVPALEPKFSLDVLLKIVFLEEASNAVIWLKSFGEAVRLLICSWHSNDGG